MSNRERLLELQDQFGIIGRSEAIFEVIETIDQVAKTDIAVLVVGESGSGKELIAKAIHNHSKRRHEPLVTVNCGAIPPGILESELFGHKKGSFTGASEERKGYFETADGGTIFLDEIGETPLETQVRLLRVIEQGEFMKVGGSENIYADVRVIAASNKDLSKQVRKNEFRKDLYYRLKAITVEVPPLRKRKEDIPLLVENFATEFCKRNNIPNKGFTEDAFTELKRYDWPGNVRELRNFVESIVILEKGNRIEGDHIRRYLHKDKAFGENGDADSSEYRSENLPVKMDKSVEEAERELILQQLFLMRRDLAEIKSVLSGKSDTASPARYQLPEHLSRNLPAKVVDEFREVVHPREFEQAEEAEPVQEDQYEEEPTLINETLVGEVTIKDVEKELILKTLEKNDNNRRKTAKDLDLSERTLYRKIKEYDL
ncbi:MAG: sigma 54-interacting transcriptional regulator [Candidatus Marinimicrobia bacterium]|nr:sigma 54-interacting transcriptional regulator [Candidatus Neomarinimicrobiota bacterium]MCF7830054.1 sigma 54-interacting transcriptional regulator [Candidatus Neomarinimicrobiota bacterium]MCF7882355.1 sigma 54-interacting transcriptional regulator [Candidatus Neomarinimicrobiota bacterium]